MNKYDGYLLIMYDISTLTANCRKTYRQFLKQLKAKGYRSALESCFYKYYDNLANSTYDINLFKSTLKSDTNVIAVKLTSKEFDDLIYLSGRKLDKLDQNISVY